MNRPLYFLFHLAHCLLAGIASTCILSACTDSKIENQLLQAESLIIEHPDSTVMMLVEMDTARMSKDQVARQELLFLYTQLIYGNQIPLDSAWIAEGDKAFGNRFSLTKLYSNETDC